MKQTGSERTMQVQPVSTGRLFGSEWLRAPIGVGAIAPSSAGLAAAMTQGVTAACGPVIDLGPGTGVFTAALLRRGISPAQIAAIEASESFAAALALRFPEVAVINDDALRIRHLRPFGRDGAGMVICGLPLLSMPAPRVLRIVAGCMTVLRADGEMRLFTYAPRCPIPPKVLERLGLTTQRFGFVALNIPPAWVYVVSRQEQKA